MKHQLETINRATTSALVTVAAATLIPALAIAGNNTNKGANPNGKPFIEIAGAIVEVEGELSSLQDQVDALVGRVTTIEDAQTAMVAAITDLQTENTTLQSQINANADDVASLEGEISALNSVIMGLEQDIADYGDANGGLQAQIDAHETTITTLALAIDTLDADLQASIDNNTALIAVMQQEIDSIQSSLDLYQLLVTGSCPAGQSIREISANGSVICEVDDANGAAGTISQYRAYSLVTTVDGYALATATCPAGSILTGGGFFANIGSSTSLAGWPRVVWNGLGDNTASREYLAEVRGAQYQGTLLAQAICIQHN